MTNRLGRIAWLWDRHKDDVSLFYLQALMSGYNPEYCSKWTNKNHTNKEVLELAFDQAIKLNPVWGAEGIKNIGDEQKALKFLTKHREMFIKPFGKNLLDPAFGQQGKGPDRRRAKAFYPGEEYSNYLNNECVEMATIYLSGKEVIDIAPEYGYDFIEAIHKVRKGLLILNPALFRTVESNDPRLPAFRKYAAEFINNIKGEGNGKHRN